MKYTNRDTGETVTVASVKDLPKGVWIEVAENGGGSCIGPNASQCACGSPVSPTAGGMQVQGQAVCAPPPNPTKTFNLSSCDPMIYGDCRHWAWFKDVLGGWKVCRNTQVGWEDTELDTCPVPLSPILYDPTNGYYYKFQQDGVYVNPYVQKSYTGWEKYTGGNIPNCLQEVYIDSVGQIYYIDPPSVESQQTPVATHPFCTTGY